MKLITKELEKRFAEVGSQEDIPLADNIIIAKLFNPTGGGTWFLANYNPETKIAFGYASIFGDHCDEWGDIYIPELEEYKGRMGLGIERDLYWKEKTAKEIDIIKKSL